MVGFCSGYPGAVFLYGLNQVWIAIGLVLGSLTCWLVVSWRLRRYTTAIKAVTVNEYLTERFRKHRKILSSVTAAMTLIFFTFYVSSGLVASGILMQKLLNMSYETSLLLGVSVVLIYTFVGGFLAVSWTDTFQGILMLAALVFLPAAALYSIGSVDEVMHTVHSEGYLDIF